MRTRDELDISMITVRPAGTWLQLDCTLCGYAAALTDHLPITDLIARAQQHVIDAHRVLVLEQESGERLTAWQRHLLDHGATHWRESHASPELRDADAAADFSQTGPPRTPAPCSFSLSAPSESNSSGPVTLRDDAHRLGPDSPAGARDIAGDTDKPVHPRTDRA